MPRRLGPWTTVVIFVVHASADLDFARFPLRTIAIIPARYGSTRLPGKALLDVSGCPLIEHVYRRTRLAPSLASVLVATDDERIRAAVERFGGAVRMTAATHRTGTDRLAEVAADLSCDVVVNVQGDEPLIEPAMIEEVIAPFATDPSIVMTTVRRRIEHRAEWLDPNVVKVVTDARDNALYFSRAPIPSAFTGDPDAFGFKHIGLYGYRRDFLLTFARLEPTPLEQRERLEQLRALEHGYAIKALETAHDSIGVDTWDDLERVRQLAASVHVREER